MIGCWNSAGCWSCSTNMPSHFPNKSFIVSPCALKTTLTALIHCNLLFCYRTNNQPCANEIIFSIIPKQPVSISSPPRFCLKKKKKLLLIIVRTSLECFYFLSCSQTSHHVLNICVCLKDRIIKYIIWFSWYYTFLQKAIHKILLLELSFSLIAFSCSDKHRCICSKNSDSTTHCHRFSLWLSSEQL